MRSSRVVVRASDRECRGRNCPGIDPSILRHSGIWGAAGVPDPDGSVWFGSLWSGSGRRKIGKKLHLFTLIMIKGNFFWFFFFYARYSTLLHLPPLRFHCVGGCWDRTQDNCRWNWLSDALTTRLDLIHSKMFLILIWMRNEVNCGIRIRIEATCGSETLVFW